jgi:thioredoxin-related protein
MKRIKIIFLFLSFLLTVSSHGASWLTDLSAARAQAAREGKHVMINFTGSDWCGWCIKLRREVFSQPEFEAYAAQNLVLVEIDFPKGKQISQATLRANSEIASQFKITGYPTLVLLNPAGNVVGRSGYQPGGARPFVQALAKATGGTVSPNDSRVPLTVAAREPVGELPLYGGAPPAAPQHFNDIVLKSISGTKERRFAMLNNITFASGETANIKLQGRIVKVQCVEIRDDSVLVAIDGQADQREIKLKAIR